MAFPTRPVLVSLGAFLLAGAALAQQPGPSPRPKIEQVRIGLPSGESIESGRVRAGAWAPVWVKIKGGKDGSGPKAYKVVVETSDTEDTPYRYTTSLPALAPNQDHFAFAYVRPSSSDITVSLQDASGREVQSTPPRGTRDMVGEQDALVLGMGGGLPRLKLSLIPPNLPKQGGPGGVQPGGGPGGGPGGPGGQPKVGKDKGAFPPQP